MPDDAPCGESRRLGQMRDELEKLKETHPNPAELDEFYGLYERFLRTRNDKIDWEKIEPPRGKLVQYAELEEPGDASRLLSKLAVLKLNGGLGTTMGCTGPKSGIKIRENMNFIDIVVRQLEHLNGAHGCAVPLVLMNSFNTDERTRKLTRNYDSIRTFTQSMFPRISAENLMPIDAQMYYPPGHGDVFYSLERSGMLDELLREGKEYLFVSNVDNLAATVDLRILRHFAEERLDFCMEVTEKTRADVKGGTLIHYEGMLALLEIAQVPAGKKSEFTSIKKFRIFNTNSAWISLRALKARAGQRMDLDIIQNRKTVGGEVVIQLETALGAAVKHFENNCGVVVPRSRFMPVKTCSDLFLLESNLYVEKNGALAVNERRVSAQQPTVKLLGENFATIDAYREAFAGIPDIADLDMLTVSGNVTFGKNVVLKGTVIVCAYEGCRINVPDGSVLEDKILAGSLSITDV